MPKIKVSESLFFQGEPSEQVFQDSGYPSVNFFALFVAKLIEATGTVLLFVVLYALDDLASTLVTSKRAKKFALRVKQALHQMILCSFAIRYAIENFLALIVTFALHVQSLYFDRHSKFKNTSTDLSFAMSVALVLVLALSWILVLVFLYLAFAKITKNSFSITLVEGLKRNKQSVLTFHCCFFLIWVLATVLIFITQVVSED